MSIDRVAGPAAPNVAVAQTEARPTPAPASVGVSFQAVLAATAKGAGTAVSVVPGGSQFAASVRGTPSMGGGAATGQLGGGVAAGGTLSPQGPTVSSGGLAVSGGVGMGSGGSGVSIGGASDGSMVGGDMASQEQALLQEQMQIQMQSQQFTAMSNILAVEHQTAMSAINNIRA